MAGITVDFAHGKLVGVGGDGGDAVAQLEQHAGQDRLAVVLRGGKHGLQDEVAALLAVHFDGERVARKTHFGKLFIVDGLDAHLHAAAGDVHALAGDGHLGERVRQAAHDLGKQLGRHDGLALLLDGRGQQAFLFKHQVGAFELDGRAGGFDIDALQNLHRGADRNGLDDGQHACRQFFGVDQEFHGVHPLLPCAGGAGTRVFSKDFPPALSTGGV